MKIRHWSEAEQDRRDERIDADTLVAKRARAANRRRWSTEDWQREGGTAKPGTVERCHCTRNLRCC